MSKWSKSVLADITEITMGQSPDSALYNDNGSGYPFLQGCADFGKRFPAPKIYCSDPKKIGRRNSILISVRAPVGELNMADQDYCIGRGVSAIYPSNVNRDFLYNAMLLNKKLFYRVSQGSTFEAINSNDLNSFQIEYPDDIALQNKIARILTTVDQAIAQTEKAIEKLKKIKQGMMHDLFTRGIDVKTGKLRPPYSDAPELYKETELGLLPKGWDCVSIDALSIRVGSGVTPTGGSEVYQEEGVIFLRSQNVTFEGLKLDDVAYINEKIHKKMANSEVFSNDVLINITGASIGRCCYVPEGFGLCNSNQHVCAIRLQKPSNSRAIYLSRFLSSYKGQNQIYRLNAGANREGLNYQQLRSFFIPWPKIEKEIDCLADKFEKQRLRLESEYKFLNKYKLIKQGLMQDLLTGKVEVTPDPQDKEYQEVS